jgi:prepilin-type N-terminal cleavage/methylation domain-containing protein
MKTTSPNHRNRALTLLELLVVLAVASVLTAMLLPAMTRTSHCTMQSYCLNNQRQIGLAFRVWAGDNNDKFPMELSETNGGTLEFTAGPNAFRHFQVMSNELSTARILYCRTDPDTERAIGTNFIFFNNSNLSYFVGVEANQNLPTMILSGDRLLTNSVSTNAILSLSKNSSANWASDIHSQIGDIALADGSVQQIKIGKLHSILKNSGVATNRLQMPILGP